MERETAKKRKARRDKLSRTSLNVPVGPGPFGDPGYPGSSRHRAMVSTRLGPTNRTTLWGLFPLQGPGQVPTTAPYYLNNRSFITSRHGSRKRLSLLKVPRKQPDLDSKTPSPALSRLFIPEAAKRLVSLQVLYAVILAAHRNPGVARERGFSRAPGGGAGRFRSASPTYRSKPPSFVITIKIALQRLSSSCSRRRASTPPHPWIPARRPE